jgi:hypothetical protein
VARNVLVTTFVKARHGLLGLLASYSGPLVAAVRQRVIAFKAKAARVCSFLTGFGKRYERVGAKTKPRLLTRRGISVHPAPSEAVGSLPDL